MIEQHPNTLISYIFKRGDCEEFVPMLSRLSKKQMASFDERMLKLRTRFAVAASAKARTRSMVSQPADGLEEAVAWVNGLAGDAFPSGQGTVNVDDSVWHSEARRGHGTE